ncbi:MAG: EAL domain-containing protein [Nitrospirae bacterium]|nr:EAL domain-containing protein [Nitrospirota bacterium]
MLNFINSNPDVVSFIYGLVLVVMGLSIFFKPRNESEFRIGRILWFLAGFGIIHGLTEWLEMWAIIKGRGQLLDLVHWSCLAVSYCFLFEFGRRMLMVQPEGTSGLQRSAVRYLKWYTSPLIVLLIFSASLKSDDFWMTSSTLTRYFMGFPGSLLTGICILLYYWEQKGRLRPLNVGRNFLGLCISFIIYGLLGGLITPPGSFFPANILNTEVFLLTVGVPAEVFKAAVAVSAAYHLVSILRIFNLNFIGRLECAAEESRAARKQLETIVREKTEELNSTNTHLQQAKTQLDLLLESVPMIIYRCRIEGGRFIPVYVSSTSNDFFTPDTNEYLDNPDWWPERLHPEDRDKVFSRFPNQLFRDGFVIHEYRLRNRNGTYRWLHDHVKLIQDEQGQPAGIVGSWLDITERKDQEGLISHMAYHDILTGLPNKNMLIDRFNQILPLMKRRKQRTAILFIDLNRFKLINDTLGHSMGDKVLKEVASRLLECIRSSDTVARLGGDEFVMVFPEISRIEDVSMLVDRVFTALEPPLILKEHEFTITASIGASICPDDGEHLETLLNRADSAMYKAKEEKQNCYKFYTMDMRRHDVERLKLEEKLRKAFENNEFLLHYQPQVDVLKEEIVGIEALVRWKNPDMGLIPPGKFIPLAEDTGLIIPLGEWIAKIACKQNRGWQENGHNHVKMAINVSKLQFKQKDYVKTIRRILSETGHDPNLLEIEITESIIMDDFDATIRLLNEIRALGIRIAIDDFGIGYSSLGYLKNMPVDILKIDQSFINNITVDEDARAICHAIISMAHSLNIDVIAEGVETIEQLTLLKELNCRKIQGYFISRPVPSNDIEDLLIKEWQFTAIQ